MNILLAAALSAVITAGSGGPADTSSTYVNPILNADYSDPDAIRVEGDYWMTASSFNHVPGLQILHPADLVHWTIVNAALPGMTPEEDFSLPSTAMGSGLRPSAATTAYTGYSGATPTAASTASRRRTLQENGPGRIWSSRAAG